MRIASPLTTEAIPRLQWIELASSFQIPNLQIIGLAAPEVAEARERVRAAIEASGYEFPKRKILINLSPASVRKRGTGADLGMALAILASGSDRFKNFSVVAWAELGLDGRLKPSGQITRSLYAAWKEEVNTFIFSCEERNAVVSAHRLILQSGEFPTDGPALVEASTLKEIWSRIQFGKLKEISKETPIGNWKPIAQDNTLLPLPRRVERMISAAVTGGHHILLMGPKGVGKSHSLEWLLSLLPPIDPKIALQNQLISELTPSPFFINTTSVPVRRIGPQVRAQALLGGMHHGLLRAGEFSLAHGGVLLADELLEWSRDSLEALREPLERGKACLNRVHGSLELPAKFRLAATANLCPCGGIPNESPRSNDIFALGVCRCKPERKRDYLSKLSGPLLDRLDLICQITLSAPSVSPLPERNLETLKLKITDAQRRLREKWQELPGDLNMNQIEHWIQERPRFQSALQSMGSLRGRHKLVRVALTLAALDGRDEPSSHHFREAQTYRPERLFA